MKFENLEEPRVLVATATRGSLTAAARSLGITPAAASASLKKLESRLGTRLFERSTRSMRLTAEGEALVGYCERALALLDEGALQIADDGQRLTGKIRMTAPSDLTRRHLLPMLDAFLDKHPGVELVLSVSDSIQDVVRDQIDVAIRCGELADSRLVAQLLLPGHCIAVASPDYVVRHGQPAHPRDLVEHECLCYYIRGRPLTRWNFTSAADGGSAIEVRVSGRRMVDDAEITQRWAIEGRGIAYKSLLDTREALAQGRLLRLLPAWLGDSMPLNAVLPSNRFMPARVRTLVAHLKTAFVEQQACALVAAPGH